MLSLFRHLLSSHRTRWLTRLFLVGLGLVFAIGLFYVPSGSPSIRNAKLVEIVEKSDTLRVSINQTQAKIGDEASLGQRVFTEQEARAGLRLTGTAGIRLDRNSAFTVGSECIQLESGKALVSGASGCIGSVIATNRGTIYVLERTGSEGEVQVLEGSVAVSSSTTPNAEPVIVNQGQKIAVRVTGEIGLITPISRSDFERILSGELFQGFQVQLPNQANLTAVLQQLPTNPQAQTPSQPSAATAPASGGTSQPALAEPLGTRIAPVARTVSQRSPSLQARAGLSPTALSDSTERPQTVRRRFRRRTSERQLEQPPATRRRDYPESSFSPPPRRRRQPVIQEPPYQFEENESRNIAPPVEEPAYREPPPFRQPPFRQPSPPFVERPPQPPQTPTDEFDPDRLRDDLRRQGDELKREIRQQFGRDAEPSRDGGASRNENRPSYRPPNTRFEIDVIPRRESSPEQSRELQ